MNSSSKLITNKAKIIIVYLISKLDGIESKTQWRQHKKKKGADIFPQIMNFWWRIGQTDRSVYAAASTVELYS